MRCSGWAGQKSFRVFDRPLRLRGKPRFLSKPSWLFVPKSSCGKAVKSSKFFKECCVLVGSEGYGVFINLVQQYSHNKDLGLASKQHLHHHGNTKR